MLIGFIRCSFVILQFYLICNSYDRFFHYLVDEPIPSLSSHRLPGLFVPIDFSEYQWISRFMFHPSSTFRFCGVPDPMEGVASRMVDPPSVVLRWTRVESRSNLSPPCLPTVVIVTTLVWRTSWSWLHPVRKEPGVNRRTNLSTKPNQVDARTPAPRRMP